MSYREELNQLFSLGEPDINEIDAINYPRQLSLTAADVPDLIQIVLENSTDIFEDPQSWAAVHGWRALSQLKAKEAIPTLIEVLERDVWEEWGWEEIPLILGKFGFDALELTYEATIKHRASFEVGIMLVAALENIAKSNKKLIEPVKAMMMELLKDADKNDEGVNGTIIGFLADNKVFEALPLIEAAFAGDNVDIFVAGDWDSVQVEFGLKDPSELKPLPSIWEQYQEIAPLLDLMDEAEEISEKAIQKKKSKRQMAKKSKQINRQKKKKK